MLLEQAFHTIIECRHAAEYLESTTQSSAVCCDDRNASHRIFLCRGSRPLLWPLIGASRTSRAQSSRLAEFGGRGISFNIRRGSGLALFSAITRDKECLVARERFCAKSTARLVLEIDILQNFWSRSRTIKHAESFLDRPGRREAAAHEASSLPSLHTVNSQKVLDPKRPIREADIQAFFIRSPRQRTRHPNLRGGTLVEEIDQKLAVHHLMGSATHRGYCHCGRDQPARHQEAASQLGEWWLAVRASAIDQQPCRERARRVYR